MEGGAATAPVARTLRSAARDVRDVLAAVRRQLGVAALVTVLVAVIAIIRYGSTAASRQQYTATQAFVVQVLPPSGGGAYTATAQQLSDRLNGLLASGASLAMPGFTRAVAAQVAQDRAQVEGRFGARAAVGLTGFDSHAVQVALTASQADGDVVVTARWSTATGAWALATAAGEVLVATPSLALGALPADMDGASLRVVPQGTVTPPTLDPAPEDAARVRLVQTILLGLVVGLALAYAADRWPIWQRALTARRLT